MRSNNQTGISGWYEKSALSSDENQILNEINLMFMDPTLEKKQEKPSDPKSEENQLDSSEIIKVSIDNPKELFDQLHVSITKQQDLLKRNNEVVKDINNLRGLVSQTTYDFQTSCI